jgi:hypothetical protein
MSFRWPGRIADSSSRRNADDRQDCEDWAGEVEAPDFMKQVHTRSTRRGFHALTNDNQLAPTTQLPMGAVGPGKTWHVSTST